MNQLNEYILKRAIEADICQEWADKIPAAAGRDELLDMYVKGIDFCLANNFPSNADLVRLGGDALPAHGVYVDTRTTLTNPELTVLLGSSRAGIAIDGFNVAQVYVKHQSDVQLIIEGNAFVVIDCFDSSRVTVNADDQAKVLINIYGDASVTANKSGNAIIKTIHKNKITY